jgi:light-regulated signal transduction histidine kinase (bacteriophytochrome)
MDKDEEIAALKLQLQQTRDSFEQFAYTVSHDMREPVRMVKSFMDLLLRKYSDNLDEKAKSYVNFASDGAGRADLMIQDLLFYYRAVRGLELAPTDLNEVFASATTKLKHKLDDRKSRLDIPALPSVMGDANGLRDVFVYLLEYLIQQVPETEAPGIQLEAEQSERSWLISLNANTSILATGELRDLFRLFYNRAQQPTADSTLNKLSVAKRIVEYLNGELIAEAAENGSVVFRLRLLKAE